jgi:hypothetical protein
MKYKNQNDGDWIKVIHRKHKIMCCDCGLVHDFNFRIRKGKIQFQAFRNQRSTGQARRHRNIDVSQTA